ncbi:glycosyltransferase family 4 protein [Streptomyces sp. GESEQ-35]|uniref:glycosyltransferase family 4 protein n=1 Tax=Streptomyces sp. GESEQ-35 TaxID=2812657 RepID=UPI001B343941|nr:glycosyltransferase family 4 protein [Streptomyces sp. GESEQ-35]
MNPSARLPRVLLLTSSPLDGQDGADIRLANDIVHALPGVEFVWFTRWPARGERAVPAVGRPVPILSRRGAPRTAERVQAAIAGAFLTRRTDLVHAVLTIGGSFPVFSRVRPLLLGSAPVLHTVPGVMNPALLGRARPLGRTVALSETTAQLLKAAGFGEVPAIAPMVPLEQWPRRPRPQGIPVVLFSGHHDPSGGAEQALAAAGVATRAGARFRLLMAMRGRPGQDTHALETALRARAAAEGLRSVEVKGYVEDMRGLLAAATVLLFPPLTLGGKADVPLTVLQALATGRPVILSDLPPFGAFGDAVLRAPAGDCLRTGRLLAWLLDRPRCWEMLAERGRTTAESRFGRERFSAQYERLYRELLP